MADAHREVIEIMRRRDCDNPGTKLFVDGGIENERNLFV